MEDEFQGKLNSYVMIVWCLWRNLLKQSKHLVKFCLNDPASTPTPTGKSTAAYIILPSKLFSKHLKILVHVIEWGGNTMKKKE
ncbi:hypothetical protein AN957_06360 [Cytobacillus solani]|uniref:Uncharacterized protein n=1 Tax=Cytobacillus solani TaxID=1637975 RepID=A0A0Q3T485_9BACI|nr:hypothetical protein AMS60_01170 [Bacillus sp. FJAT-21945]KQL18245.1 hypothetical protein AN957_06360 [Cytobacillus solani]